MEKDYWIKQLWQWLITSKEGDPKRAEFLRICLATDSYLCWSFDTLSNLTENEKLDGFGLYIETVKNGYLQQAIFTDFDLREEDQDLLCNERFCLLEFRKFMARNFRGYKEDCLKHIEEVELRKAQKRINRDSKPLNELTIREDEFIK